MYKNLHDQQNYEIISNNFFKNVVVVVLGGFRSLEWACQKVFGESIELYKTNKIMKKYPKVV